MIVIFSRSNDGTTTEVIRWIRSLSTIPVLRINSDIDDFKFITYDSEDKKFLISKKEKVFNLFDIKSYWYRKGGKKFLQNDRVDIEDYKGLRKGFIEKLGFEKEALIEFIHRFAEIHTEISLGSNFNATPNKMHVLGIAENNKLKVPNTFIINNKMDLLRKIDIHGELITKAISDGIYVYNKDYSFYSYTELINRESLSEIAEVFFPSLFQTKIEKKFEVRTFVLDKKTFSMAIISQNNTKTQVDFRKYDGKKPNRFVPFILPKEIEINLLKVFEELKMNTGSVDFIVDMNDDFIFLEINPVGQFSMVSYPCNYFLEKKVANYLIPA